MPSQQNRRHYAEIFVTNYKKSTFKTCNICKVENSRTTRKAYKVEEPKSLMGQKGHSSFS